MDLMANFKEKRAAQVANVLGNESERRWPINRDLNRNKNNCISKHETKMSAYDVMRANYYNHVTSVVPTTTTTTSNTRSQPLLPNKHNDKAIVWTRLSFSQTSTTKGESRSSGTRSGALLLSMMGFLVLVLLLVGQLAFGIKLQPEGKEKFYWSGEQFVITCQNNNNIKNVKIRWIGPNGSYITEDRSKRIHAESSGPHGHRLVVMNATAGLDDGQYKCTIGSTDDRSPRENTGFNLKLYQTTSFKDTARSLVLPTGQTGTLNCRVEFDPNVSSASVSWVRDHKPIEMFNDSAISVLDYDPGRQLSQLIISPVSREHEGKYTCQAVAVTSQLSKISDFDIELETNYAPSFDSPSQTVWVESSQSVANRLAAAAAAAAANQHQPQHSGNQHQQQHAGAHNQQQQQQHLQHKNIFASNVARNRLNKYHYPQRAPEGQAGGANLTGHEDIVPVELRCSCQANPPASILWTSTQVSRYVLTKGEPAHILEEPRLEVNGHNSTSILVVGYNLDTNWPYRRDSYICSASNKLGKATKTFTIEQGDPPPAFNVGPNKQYDPQTMMFKFTLLGPNFDPDATSPNGQSSMSAANQQQADIVPPVDSFRIRAEISSSAATSESRTSYARRQLEPSVQWNINNNYRQQSGDPIGRPGAALGAGLQNFTVYLGRLPSGSQRLFLEAHNAVGWSPNATYLGDYYIVNGAASLLHRSMILTTLSLQLALSLALSCLTIMRSNSMWAH